ncbi:MAG: cell wall hydrolase [Chromatiales bacterium]
MDVNIEQEVHCLALNIYFEARGESEQGQRAVGHVVLNRVADKHYPDTICDVVKQGGESHLNQCQFSWWCDGRSDRPINRKAWRNALRLANAILDGESKDPTNGALWYHADYVNPYWSNVFTLVKKIGQHSFYLHKKQPENESARSQERRDS